MNLLKEPHRQHGAESCRYVARQSLADRTLLQTRCRWAVGLVKAFVGEAIGNPRMETEGTVDKLICRLEIEKLQRRRLFAQREQRAPKTRVPDPIDVKLHDLAATQLELAARHHRDAVRCYESGDYERARYHAWAAQASCMDIRDIIRKVGQNLWRSLRNPE